MKYPLKQQKKTMFKKFKMEEFQIGKANSFEQCQLPQSTLRSLNFSSPYLQKFLKWYKSTGHG